MSRRALQLSLAASLVTCTVWAANDPFVGEWKLNDARSKIIDVMKVESVSGNKYAFDLGGGAETIAVDGTDQPGYGGTTLSVAVEGPDSWKVVRKKDGRKLLTANWKLSEDGNTLADDFTAIAPDGSTTNVNYVYRRTTGTSGFAGTWESANVTINSVFVLKLQLYEGDGLSIIDSAEGQTTNLKFDGKDYPNVGPNASPGSASSARRVNQRALEITNKFNGKTVGTQHIALSTDLKTLTMTIDVPGRSAPNILVFDRQ